MYKIVKKMTFVSFNNHFDIDMALYKKLVLIPPNNIQISLTSFSKPTAVPSNTA